MSIWRDFQSVANYALSPFVTRTFPITNIYICTYIHIFLSLSLSREKANDTSIHWRKHSNERAHCALLRLLAFTISDCDAVEVSGAMVSMDECTYRWHRCAEAKLTVPTFPNGNAIQKARYIIWYHSFIIISPLVSDSSFVSHNNAPCFSVFSTWDYAKKILLRWRKSHISARLLHTHTRYTLERALEIFYEIKIITGLSRADYWSSNEPVLRF